MSTSDLFTFSLRRFSEAFTRWQLRRELAKVDKHIADMQRQGVKLRKDISDCQWYRPQVDRELNDLN